MMPLKYGLNPTPKDSRDLQFRDYVTLPKPPSSFGHESLVHNWGMLGNDEYGDCYFAGAAHEHMLWTAAGGKPVSFTTAGVLGDYARATGFDPNAGPPGRNPTDQGTDLRQGAKYRQNVGLLDAAGNRHKIGAYLFLRPGDSVELAQALYLFEAVGIALQLPQSAEDQFNAHRPWEPVSGSPIAGGHYVPTVKRKRTLTIDVITWSRVEPMVKTFYPTFGVGAIVYLTPELLKDGKSLEGFNLPQLQDDFRQLKGA